jgi:tetratricopeptide (TPR) repeat protein
MLVVGLVFVSFALNAQDLNDAKREIKKGDQKKRSDEYVAAIESYSKCVSIIDELGIDAGEEAVEIMAAAEKKWVKTHLDYANELLQQEKFDEALTHYNKVVELGQQYNQDDYVDKANKNIPKVWYAKGKAQISAKNYDDALKYLDKAIEGDPEYGWAYIRKAQIYLSQEQPDKLEKAVEEAVAIGEETGNDKVVKTATQVGYKYFYNHGATALKGKNYEKAAEYLSKATKYNGSATIYHYLAISYGQISKYEKAIESEEKVIEMLKDSKSSEELAKYYYSLAGYYKEVGNNTKACDAYKNAAYGQYKANAEYQIKHILKCN